MPPTLAAGPPSLERSLTGSTGAKPETEAKLQDLVSQLFALADVDSSGTIQFKEFMDHHNRVLEIASDSLGRAEVMSGEEAQKIFRQADKDHNHRLDKEEFFDYMHGLLSVVGIKQFESVCETLVKEETLRRAVMAEGFDRKFSERLLEQATNSYFYKQPMKDAALKLLNSRADPNMTDKNGSTILLHVTGKMDAPFAKQLLLARCDPLRHNKELDCAVFRASKSRHMEVLKVLLEPDWNPPVPGEETTKEQDENSPRYRAKMSEEVLKQMPELTGAQLKQLIAKRADLNYKGQNGWTPLTLAVFHGKKDCVEALVRVQDPLKGMKLHLQGKNARGRAALHLAARKDLPEIAKLLISSGADADVKDIDGWTPLHHACFNGNSAVVRELLAGGAQLLIRGNGGFTAFMVTKLPQKASDLSDAVLNIIKPSEGVDFSKRVIPLVKDETMTPLQKIEELLMLPGVSQVPERLRLHETFFHPLQGPNKVKLKLVWTHLIKPLIPRLRTCEVDMDVEPSPHLSEQAKEEHRAEVARRRKLQDHFFKQWALDTRGPRPTAHWKFDNREAYKEELYAILQLELDEYRAEFNKLYERLTDEEECGEELVALPPEEIIHKSLLSQLNAHTFPLWLEQLDVAGAFEQLRLVGHGSLAGKKDNRDAQLEMVELLTISHSLRCGKMFWRNVYRTWLLQCASMADHECSRKVRSIVDKFNAEHEGELIASYHPGPVKTADRTKYKEQMLGLKPSAETFDGRGAAANIIDVVRGTIAVNCPKAALKLLDVFRSLDKSMDRMLLVRVINRYNSECETLEGYRFVEMHLLFRNGVRAGACGRDGTSIELSLLGEVCIVLDDFLKVHKKRHLVYKLRRGVFDWSPEDEEPEDDDFESSLRGDDLTT
ncbi:unnamed protein product [Effrenium voratum]|uniref:EF-hand domain-containing protein n=1 Tax=Effrenium voratum TaxID=2562239 RepID=A0AA36J5W7_9DINO|nr:unnamed protein product [Effrenium voratum]CAJ1399099.1 unnamed protein product [Effrenium voratum]CAJ1451178.1 unnamed protein product [Effrenium voratum]|mmetsp:Transcript_78472/g.188158  ORF Transcript_78472/g.188158 Transcript_78472/m.188158 type:complete len:889 (+) Transcript_78472:89-2755(+)